MVLPTRLMSLEGLYVAIIGGTWKYGEGGVTKKKGDWYVLHKGMLFPHIDVDFG